MSASDIISCLASFLPFKCGDAETIEAFALLYTIKRVVWCKVPGGCLSIISEGKNLSNLSNLFDAISFHNYSIHFIFKSFNESVHLLVKIDFQFIEVTAFFEKFSK